MSDVKQEYQQGLLTWKNLGVVVLIGLFPPLFLAFSSHLHTGRAFFSYLLTASWFSVTVTAVLYSGTVWIIHSLQQRMSWQTQPILRFVTELIAIVVYAFVGMYLLSFFFYHFIFHNDDFRADLFQNELLAIIISAFVTMFMEGKYFFSQWKASLVRGEQMKREMSESQYEALKNQVNPHFLFNSLNTLSALVHHDPDKAIHFIAEFSKIYRYVLEVTNKVVIELSREVEFLQSYCYLQQIRFGENLYVEINLPADRMDEWVPPLSLQMLVENAIKHNRISKEEPLHIVISAQDHFLIVKNNLQLRQDAAGSTGIGLKNLANRYQTISGRQPSFEAEGKYFVARIPLITAQ